MGGKLSSAVGVAVWGDLPDGKKKKEPTLVPGLNKDLVATGVSCGKNSLAILTASEVFLW